MIDIQSFATGFVVALLVIVLLATPLFECVRRILKEARETIQAQQEDLDDLFRYMPLREANGRFAKRQENNHG